MVPTSHHYDSLSISASDSIIFKAWISFLEQIQLMGEDRWGETSGSQWNYRGPWTSLHVCILDIPVLVSRDTLFQNALTCSMLGGVVMRKEEEVANHREGIWEKQREILRFIEHLLCVRGTGMSCLIPTTRLWGSRESQTDAHRPQFRMEWLTWLIK